ncbi:MAG: hypothetical protein RIK00_11835 [Algiphilus sp.]|uniref:hypothetical protein n=1 Tax=Algiphilus sp. TaxID=1872431 RepID=UPI0032EDD6DE
MPAGWEPVEVPGRELALVFRKGERYIEVDSEIAFITPSKETLEAIGAEDIPPEASDDREGRIIYRSYGEFEPFPDDLKVDLL